MSPFDGELLGRIRACLRDLRQPGRGGSEFAASRSAEAAGAAAESASRWAAAFEELRGSPAAPAPIAVAAAVDSGAADAPSGQCALLAFLNELPIVCPSLAHDAADFVTELLRDGGAPWLAAARALCVEAAPADGAAIDAGDAGGALAARAEGPVFEALRAAEGALAQRVEAMLSRVLGGHPDADVLLPLAILEVATDDDHRVALEELLSEPGRFRDYASAMVNVPSQGLGDTLNDTLDSADEASLLRVCSHDERSRIVSQLASRLDESVQLDELDESADRCNMSLNASGHIDLDASIRSLADLYSPRRSSTGTAAAEDSARSAARVVPRVEVRKAYLQLAKQYHPDKGGDQEMFLALHDAYELLRADSHESSAVAC